ncbi:MAG: TonB-dependent receptor [Novosphingobium sp.]|nr:TonB-dependent receptor [Novosphingobium sp.]
MRSFCEVHRLGRQGDRHVPSPRLAMLAALMVSTAMIPQQAYAQSSGAAPADAEQHAAATSSGSTLQDIVVTARRRSESISKTPMSIVALTTADMAAQQIVTETDIQRSVPGVTVRQGLSQNQINYSIRGQTIDSYSSSPPGVLPYVNDVQISTSGANAFFDLESIQILKGPQGTLFGRNTTGGAVLFATRKPTFEFGGEATVRFGDYDDRGIRGAINIPLVADTIALRIAGDYHRRDGYVKNIYAGPEDPGRRDLGAIDTQSIRASLLIRPAEGIENITVFQYG